jgi:thioredoxin reductase (NADPH)
LVIEKEKNGGQIVTTSEIENYPGCLSEESGASLVKRMTAQLEKFGAERVSDSIVSAELEGKVKVLKGAKAEYRAKAVIIAGGAIPRPIGCEGERKFVGKGVSYCATCDGALFEDFEVYVVGGGDSAVEEAMFLTKFARKVTIIHRRDQLKTAKSIQEKVFANPKIDFLWNSEIVELKGEGILQSMIVKDTVTGATREILADEDDGTFGVFVFIGLAPQTEIYKDSLKLAGGYIVTDENMFTGIPGVYAAGDIRQKAFRQVVTAVADGAIAVHQAEKYLDSIEG